MEIETQLKGLITAQEVVSALGCSRGNVERLQLKGVLTPVPTIYPKYYFRKTEVKKLKRKLTSKKVVL